MASVYRQLMHRNPSVGFAGKLYVYDTGSEPPLNETLQVGPFKRLQASSPAASFVRAAQCARCHDVKVYCTIC